jgi:hypothetical protein
MTLAQASLALAALLAAAGALVAARPAALVALRRSRSAGAVLGLAAIALLAWHLLNLPEPDLAGFPRLPVLAVFVLGSLAAFVWMPDLLPVRALGCLMMFLARAVLDAGWMQLPHSLTNAILAYVLLVIPGLWWAASPGAYVRQTDALAARPTLRRAVAGLLLAAAAAALVSWFRAPR